MFCLEVDACNLLLSPYGRDWKRSFQIVGLEEVIDHAYQCIMKDHDWNNWIDVHIKPWRTKIQTLWFDPWVVFDGGTLTYDVNV